LALCSASARRVAGHGKTKGYVLFESGLLISGAFDHVPRKR
jgi:hypothetical protein